MTWGRMDDKFHRNRKVRELKQSKAGREALGIWVCRWSWCLDDPELSGLIPRIDLSAAEQKAAKMLVAVGLWDVDEMDDYHIHDFHSYNPTKTQIESKRHADRERVALKREAIRGNVARDTLATNTRVASTRVPMPMPILEEGNASQDAAPPDKPKKQRKGDPAIQALRAALKRHIEVPPVLSTARAGEAASRLQDIIDAGHASTLDEAATCLVLAAQATGKDFPWCLMDAQPRRARPDYDAIASRQRQENQGVRV